MKMQFSCLPSFFSMLYSSKMMWNVFNTKHCDQHIKLSANLFK
eukprot:UN12544